MSANAVTPEWVDLSKAVQQFNLFKQYFFTVL